jgi:hypothetical protein
MVDKIDLFVPGREPGVLGAFACVARVAAYVCTGEGGANPAPDTQHEATEHDIP